VGKYGAEKLGNILRSEISDLFLQRINFAVQRRMTNLINQFTNRDQRVTASTWVKPTPEEPNPEPKEPKVKRAAKNYKKTFEKSLKWLDKMDKFGKEWDSLVNDICTKAEEQNWIKDVNDEKDKEKIESAIKGMDKAYKTRQKLMQEFKKELMLADDFVANPQFTKYLDELGIFKLPKLPKESSSSKKKKKEK